MKNKVRLNLQGVYDLFLSFGAIYTGVLMIKGEGVFNDYPKEWLPKVPFQSWLWPGVIGIIVFGLGNLMAAVFSFRKKGSSSWIVSAVMAGVFFISMAAQYMIFREWYLPSAMFLILSIFQVVICGSALIGCRRTLSTGRSM